MNYAKEKKHQLVKYCLIIHFTNMKYCFKLYNILFKNYLKHGEKIASLAITNTMLLSKVINVLNRNILQL